MDEAFRLAAALRRHSHLVGRPGGGTQQTSRRTQARRQIRDLPQLDLFGEVFERVRADYVEEVTDQQLDRGGDQRHAERARPAFELHERQELRRHAGAGRVSSAASASRSRWRTGRQGGVADRRHARGQGRDQTQQYVMFMITWAPLRIAPKSSVNFAYDGRLPSISAFYNAMFRETLWHDAQ